MAALPHLKRAGRGALIHISSVEAKRSFPFHSAYGASKHGIDGFLEALRVELKHEGWPISVTQVMPGTINTPFFDKGRTKLGVKPVGVPPIYEPETVANMILYAAENPVRDLERVMNLGENRIEMRIPQSAWFPRDLCFLHS